jgi:hypothetical protein
MDPKKVVAILD